MDGVIRKPAFYVVLFAVGLVVMVWVDNVIMAALAQDQMVVAAPNEDPTTWRYADGTPGPYQSQEKPLTTGSVTFTSENLLKVPPYHQWSPAYTFLAPPDDVKVCVAIIEPSIYSDCLTFKRIREVIAQDKKAGK